jgi:1-acyl-sn-glycerol-3-phosphate acyltransferase
MGSGVGLELQGVYLYNLTLLILRVSRPFMLRDEVSGDEVVKSPGPLVIASNHVGWLEILLISAALWPRKVRFMAKRELFAHPAAAWALRGLGAFPINREHPAPSEWKTAIRLLREGDAICVLASGTRGGQQAKQGVARLALASGARLVTARYEGPSSPKARFLLKRPHVTLHFDIALESDDRQGRSSRSQSDEITRRVNESIHAQKTPG